MNKNFSSDWFSNEDSLPDLKGKSIRGGLFVVSSQIITTTLQVVSTIILARLLVPEDFGLIAMVSALMALFSLLSDLGLSSAIIQKKSISNQEVSNLFWINLSLGFILMLAACSLAIPVAGFYSDERLIIIVAVLALNFVGISLGVEHSALLTRNMEHRTLAIVRVITTILSIGIAFVVAKLGGTYWALVAQQLSMVFVNTLLLWIVCSWRPLRYNSEVSVKEFVSFGGYLVGFNLLNFFTRNLDRILIGRFWGPTPVGYYGSANRLLLMPISLINGPMSGVVVPSLSRLREYPDRYQKLYLKALAISCTTIFPLAFISWAYSAEIITTLLGPRWLPSAEIFRLLSGVILAQPIMSSLGWLYLSNSQTKEMFQWSWLATPIIVLAFLIGVRDGARGTALAFSLAMMILVFPGVWWAVRKNPVNGAAIFKIISVPALVSGSVVFGVHFFYEKMRNLLVGSNAQDFLWIVFVGVSLAVMILVLSFSRFYQQIFFDLIKSTIVKYRERH